MTDKKTPGPAPRADPASERLQEIFDEDHLEFEELLLDIQKKVDLVLAQIKLLSQQASDSRTEIIESREMIENLQGKTDRLLTITAEWQRDRADAGHSLENRT